jgi:hypothetical protein
MEDELSHWIAISQRQSGGVEKDAVCRVGYALMASDPEHFERVQAQHPEYRNLKRRMFSADWFQKLRKRYPDLLRRHRSEAYQVGRAQVTRAMVDSIYDVLQVLLAEADELIPACNVWNFDETGHKVQYCRTFLYGLAGSQGNQAESVGNGEHVTIGATANLNGDHLDPVFLFVGAESSKAKLTTQLKETGFENPLVLMKKGKASMDDVLFTEYLQWFSAELARKGYTGQHILMVDNHDSHERSRPIQAAMLNNVVIFTFPSHCTHLVQMLDVCFFGSLKATFKAVCKTWLDEQEHERKPYISKLIFLQLFQKAWIRACKPQTFKNGWARMGLSSCPETGMVVINRRAILDVCLGGSEKYQEGLVTTMEQSIRVRGGTNAEGVFQYHDYKFDFSAAGLATMELEKPEAYAQYLATRTFLFAQPGFAMHQPDTRPCKIAQPCARILTTDANVLVAQRKDATKMARTTTKKMKALADIGKELGKVINVDGIDLVAKVGRGERNVFCEFCKQTLTRACTKAKCKALAVGGPTPRKVQKRKRGKEEWCSDDDDSDEEDAQGSAADEDDAVALSPEHIVSSTEPWTHDPKGNLIIGRVFQVIILTEQEEHQGVWAKVDRYRLFENKFHMLWYKYASPSTGTWTYEFSSVQEVYEAVIASASQLIPKEDLAQFTTTTAFSI